MKPVVGLLVPSSEALSVWGDDVGRRDRARGPPAGCAVVIRNCIAFPKRNRIMKRLTVVFLVTLAALVAAAPSAQAAPPTHERVPIDDEFTDQSCGFPVQVHVTGFMLVIEWADEDGTIRRFEGFPQARTTFTNLITGESITVSAAGSAHITDNPDGSFTAVGTGNWGFPVDPETGEPGVVLFSGRWVFIEAQGTTSFSFVGQKVDLCAELAA
jgi:hypothetical protein